MPQSAIWLTGTMVYTKIYSISAMVSLNMRHSLKPSQSRSRASAQVHSGSIQITRTYNIETNGVESTHDTDDIVMPSSFLNKLRELMGAFSRTMLFPSTPLETRTVGSPSAPLTLLERIAYLMPQATLGRTLLVTMYE
jgi:hypothetical protein